MDVYLCTCRQMRRELEFFLVTPPWLSERCPGVGTFFTLVVWSGRCRCREAPRE